MTQTHRYGAILSGLILLLILLYPRSQPTPILKTEKPQFDKIKPGYMLTVTIDHKTHYIAQKLDKHEYALRFVPLHADIQRCQAVLTTGLDQQFREDVLVGYVSSITHNPDDIYQTVTISGECPEIREP